ncbi:hypothetical protein K474DRAFT_1581489, partial [Panus rudis PR-1116 ss-1]
SSRDLEDWINLKELYVKAAELCESDETVEALPLLRAVIRECTRILSVHPDPSVIYLDPQQPRKSLSPVQAITPTEERLSRDWSNETLDSSFSSNNIHKRPQYSATEPNYLFAFLPHRNGDLPTAFHTLFGTSLYLMGSIISQDPSLALPDEPSNGISYWLAALDVFESGESLPCLIDGRGVSDASEDWQMAIAWGRTLVLPTSNAYGPFASSYSYSHLHTSSPFPLTEPTWPKDSPFHVIAMTRPPVTRRMSMILVSAHEILVLATDQFSRGIFHMPHPRRSYILSIAERLPSSSSSRTSSSSPSSYTSPSTINSTRTNSIITNSSHTSSPSPSTPSPRIYWAKWADSILNQMKMEADMEAWRWRWKGAVTRARGRCWLVVGSAWAEEVEGRLEISIEDKVREILNSEDAQEAREGLGIAISFFERAKGWVSSSSSRVEKYGTDGVEVEDGMDGGDGGDGLAEALLTLANLTIDENKREELYSRAQREGGEEVVAAL